MLLGLKFYIFKTLLKATRIITSIPIVDHGKNIPIEKHQLDVALQG